MSHSTRTRQLPQRPDTGPEPDTDAATEVAARADGDGASGADADGASGSDTDAGVRAEEDGVSGSEADADAGADTATAKDADGTSERDTEPDTVAEADTAPDTDTLTDEEPETPAATGEKPKVPGATDEEPDAPAAADEAPAADTSAGQADGPSGRPGRWGWRLKYPRAARAVTVGTTALAGVLVLFALLVPNQLDRLAPDAFLRIPVEGVLLAGLLLVLPPRPRRIAAVVVGLLLGLVTILKFVDMGFYSVLARPFDLVLDWILFDDAAEWVKESFGKTGEVVAVIAVLALVVVLLTLMTLAVVRLSDLMARHRPVATRTVLVLGTAWITCVTVGVQFTDVPVASQIDAELVKNRVHQVRAGLRDGKVFAEQASVDAFADTPPDQLLTGLRGKDVLFTFIESYGRTAIDDPAMADQVGSVLSEGTKSLKSAGFASRSAWLRSPVTGAGSWLAHSTFLSGLWIKNQQRYRSLTTSDRYTLTSYFQKSGAWRTVGIVPGVRRAWPEGKFFGLDLIYDSEHLGYHGPYFSWTPVPDQFSLEAFERLEHGKKDRKPMMAEIILASSHNPWAPVAHMIDWNDLGDGSVFEQIKKEGKDPKEVWKNPESVRTEYRHAIEYSLHSLIEYVERYGDKNTVLVFLGDHQPVPTVTAGSSSRDVPVTIVAHDPKVLDRISDWGWTDGLKPAKNAPEWRMDTFRDRFMTAYGSRPGTSGAASAR
ncbi:sulfatase [Streptomyces sp. Tue6028]|uniref:sulfatase n=1 Tax=Streptomyces sp. Tue6028 TaxID=2036037 RepID=UPI000BB2F41F|nr:sulfatase [Streptomyces sp. Tue6028]PBC65946.1 sulfatase [Streptomyces sp. Tue6028]